MTLTQCDNQAGSLGQSFRHQVLKETHELAEPQRFQIPVMQTGPRSPSPGATQ